MVQAYPFAAYGWRVSSRFPFLVAVLLSIPGLALFLLKTLKNLNVFSCFETT